MQPNGSVTYVPHDDAGPKAELSALVNIYKYVLDRNTRKEATCPGSPDAAKETKNDSRHSKYTK
jgi:hypothetical protein